MRASGKLPRFDTSLGAFIAVGTGSFADPMVCRFGREADIRDSGVDHTLSEGSGLSMGP